MRHRNATGCSFISATPFRRRSAGSSFELTRMWRRNVRAILENTASMRFNQEPCFGVWT